jgi:fused signal recognition particle receptor
MGLTDHLLTYGAIVTALVIAVLVMRRLLRRPAPRLEQPAETPAETRPALPTVGAPAPGVEAQRPKPAEKPRPLLAGLQRTRSGFVARLSGLLGSVGGKQIDAQLVSEMEEVLFTADIGAKTASLLLEGVRQSLSRDELKSPEAVWAVIRKDSREILERAQAGAGPIDLGQGKPFVVLTIGVNGVGKTTTIGKLAAKWRAQGKKVLLAAGDTFRAAATEQLEIWGERVGSPVVRGKEGADPSSVIFEGIRRAQAEGYDILIADTAGRLHTKSDLMEELQKVRRVIQKAEPTAPHETILVLDATNGQNAIAQATLFKQAMSITGIVLTKLDGTAKGGVILGICDELKVPVRFIGIGEKVEDLREFDPTEFVEALFETGAEASA